MSIVVFGSINMDLTAYVPRLPHPGETLLGSSFITVPGGKGANQAVAVARLGTLTKLVGRVGDDAFGGEVVEAIQQQGVDCSPVIVDPESGTGLAVISVDEQAENSIIVISGANMQLDQTDVERCIALLDDAQVLMLQLEAPLEASIAVARAAQERHVTVIFDPAPARRLPDDLFSYVDIITPNETETETLVGIKPTSAAKAQEAAELLLAKGVSTAIIKMGAQGAYLHLPDMQEMIPAYTVDAIDTVAAGDAFNGGLAVALAEGRGLAEAVRWGTAAGAIATTRKGAMPAMPRRAELEQMLQIGSTN